ncbi:hypothetical protein BELL_2175g00010 [Botrytis elliptica]|uniref:Uncharacterized protein n=1 Tax=Botrytis elliptica TaxID=278938 RepID=A0A4Z1HCN3_9HELO|nr:hypothetical protein BELL_2175g00010 [Botrytis elliptica]
MYSDDGILFFKKDEDLKSITETPKFKRSGIEFALEKYRKLLVGDRWYPADKLNEKSLKDLLAGRDPYTMIGKEKVNWE